MVDNLPLISEVVGQDASQKTAMGVRLWSILLEQHGCPTCSLAWFGRSSLHDHGVHAIYRGRGGAHALLRDLGHDVSRDVYDAALVSQCAISIWACFKNKVSIY